MVPIIDIYFPYIVLLYGLVMTMVTNLPGLQKKARETMDTELLNWFYGHKMMGSVCLFVGALWSAQRLFI